LQKYGCGNLLRIAAAFLFFTNQSHASPMAADYALYAYSHPAAKAMSMFEFCTESGMKKYNWGGIKK